METPTTQAKGETMREPTQCACDTVREVQCALHAAAPELLAALEAMLATGPGADPVDVLKADDMALSLIHI